MLALILATKNDLPAGDFSNTTLIGNIPLRFPSCVSDNFNSVTPLSVLSNWEKQVHDHCADGSLSVYVYHGANRSKSPERMRSCDIIITTYQTVAGEYFGGSHDGPVKKKRKIGNGLFQVPWKVG